jgi:hypothetical protein
MSNEMILELTQRRLVSLEKRVRIHSNGILPTVRQVNGDHRIGIFACKLKLVFREK